MATEPSPFVTPQQYLELDSKDDHRSEYYDGQMHVVEATTLGYSLIQLNLVDSYSPNFVAPSVRG